MSAPLLSPVDTPIYDDMIVEDMQERFDDEVMCKMGDMPASSRLVMRCCGNSAVLCDEHVARERLAVALMIRGRCKHCRRYFPAPVFDDVYRVVPL